MAQSTPTNEPRKEQAIPQSRREKMFEAEMANQQLGQLQEYLGGISKQTAEILMLKEEIDRYAKVNEGDEMLVPLAAGIFVKARAAAHQGFLVNVGSGAVVPKDAVQVHAMLDRQIAELRDYEGKIQEQFDTLLKRLEELQAEFASDGTARRG